MSYTLTTLEQTIYQAIAIVLPGETIIWADQDGPRPSSGTFVTCKVTGDSGQGLRSFCLTDTAGVDAGDYVWQVGRFRESTLLMQAYGPEAYGTLRSMELQLDDPLNSDLISRLGIVMADPSGTQRIPAVLPSETEDRATCTYTVRYYSITERDVAALRSIDATPVYNGVAQTPHIILNNLDA